MSSPEEKFDREVATALRELVPEPPAAVDLMNTVAARVRRRRRVRASVAATASAVAVVAVGVIPAVLLTGGSTNGQPTVAPAPPRSAAAPDCPASPPFNALGTPHRPGTNTTLVPPTPTVASVCEVEATVTRAVVLRGDELTALVAALDTLPPVHSQICSAVLGPHIRLVFGYGSGPVLLVDTAPAGCYATNGAKEVSLNRAVDTRLAAYLDHSTDGTARPLVTAGPCAGLTVHLTYHGQSKDAAPLPDSTAAVLDVGDELTLRATGACEEQVGYDPDDPPMLRPIKQGVGITDPRRIVLTASTPGHETVNITEPSCAGIPPSTTPCVGGLGVIGRIDVRVQPAGAASGVTVPNVVGLDRNAAMQALVQANLSDVYVAVIVDNDVPAQTVLSQVPAGGAQVASGTSIRLRVANASVAPMCTSASLRLREGAPFSEPTGQHTLTLTVTNAGPATCTLSGYPTVTVLDGAGRALPFAYSHHGDQVVTDAPPGDVQIGPGGAAFVTLNKYRCDAGNKATAARVDLQLPATSDPLTLDLEQYPIVGYCGPGDPGSTVAVSPVEPTLRDTLAPH